MKKTTAWLVATAMLALAAGPAAAGQGQTDSADSPSKVVSTQEAPESQAPSESDPSAAPDNETPAKTPAEEPQKFVSDVPDAPGHKPETDDPGTGKESPKTSPEAPNDGASETQESKKTAAKHAADEPRAARAASLNIPAGYKQYHDPNDATVTYWAPESVEVGEDIVVYGHGWKAAQGGSVIATLIDAISSGHEDTVHTKRNVINPTTKKVSGDKRLHAIVAADDNGNWTATVPFPTPANAYNGFKTGSPAIPAWKPGEEHEIRFLTGSMKDGDKGRSLPATFTIAGEDPTAPTDPPRWRHVTATQGQATAWVQSAVWTEDGSTIRIKGKGWLTQDGKRGSTVALKLNRGDTSLYTRSGSAIVQHPSASGDDTIWALLAPAGSATHPNVHTMNSDGTFNITVDAPKGMKPGQYLTATFLSGRFGLGDVQRSVTSDFLTVGGVPYDRSSHKVQATCRATSTQPTVSIDTPFVERGGVLKISGKGWCHPGAKRGGSVIGIKIDEGKYSHVNDKLHKNRTIWAIVEAKETNGEFSASIQLPDGTSKTSTPAFSNGAHTLRLLSGTLKSGDTTRTLKSKEFVVGVYKPNGTPEPLEATDDLKDKKRGGVTVSRTKKHLTVTIPKAKKGDWIYLNVYEGSSPRFPWKGTWFRANKKGVVRAPLKGVALPGGRNKLSVQSGNLGQNGKLLGWAWVDGPRANSGGPQNAANRAPMPAVTPRLAAAIGAMTPPALVAPTTNPAPPVPDREGLTKKNKGEVTARLKDGIATVTVAQGAPNDWVYLHLYSSRGVTPIGWLSLNDAKSTVIDVSKLQDDDYRISALGADEKLLGWAKLTIGEGASNDVDAPLPTTADAEQSRAAAVVPTASSGLSTADTIMIALATLIGAIAAGAFGFGAGGSKPQKGNKP